MARNNRVHHFNATQSKSARWSWPANKLRASETWQISSNNKTSDRLSSLIIISHDKAAPRVDRSHNRPTHRSLLLFPANHHKNTYTYVSRAAFLQSKLMKSWVLTNGMFILRIKATRLKTIYNIRDRISRESAHVVSISFFGGFDFGGRFEKPQLFHLNNELAIKRCFSVFWWWLCSEILLYFETLLEKFQRPSRSLITPYKALSITQQSLVLLGATSVAGRGQHAHKACRADCHTNKTRYHFLFN